MTPPPVESPIDASDLIAARPISGVQLEVFTSFDEVQQLAPEWDAVTKELNGSLYTSFSWCEVWWRHYGTGRDLRLFTVRVEEELRGVLPFFIDRLRLPIGRARVARLVGSDSTLTVVEPLVDADVEVEALGLAMRQLFADDGADLVFVGPCSAATASIEAIRRSAADVSDVARVVRDRESGTHSVFDLSEGFDGYMRGLNSRERSNYKRKVKKLDNAFKIDIDVVRDARRLDSEFEKFVAMHQTQWKAVNKLGHFGDWPASREFSRDLLQTLARADQVRLLRVLADDQVVTYYWCLRLNATYYDRLSARAIGPKWDQFALGRIGLMKIMETAAEDGATSIEAGTGRYAWKEQLNAQSFPVYSIALCRRGLVSRLRTRLLLASGDLLHLGYYRLWYLRIAPRSPLPRKPLRQAWIRRRF